MAAFPTSRLVLFARPRKDGTLSVALRVTYRRKSKFFFLNRHCFRADWDEKAGRFKKSFPDHRRENDMLLTYERRASDAIRNMERDGIPFTFQRFEQAVFADQQGSGGSVGFVLYLRGIRDELQAVGKYGNSRFYHQAANTVEAYRPKAALADLDSGWLSKFERWMNANREMNGGGLSIQMRTLRAACNLAIKDKIMPRSWYPFEGYSLAHLAKGKAKKSAGLEFIRALEGFSPVDDRQALAVDLFLFSFYTRGMNLADIAELTFESIQGGRVTYTRKKTGRVYSVALSDRAEAVVAKYATTQNGRLFPIYLSDGMADAAKHWRRNKVSTKINRALREIAAALGFQIPGLSFYTARHTYADSLKKAGVSVDVISQALGHSDVRTTDNYLKSFGDDVIDAADRLLE